MIPDDDWRQMKLRLPVLTEVRCEVTSHARFGFFVAVDDYPELNAVVLAPDFERSSIPVTSFEDFPEVGSHMKAEVIDHIDETKQVRLRVGQHVHIEVPRP